MSETFEEKLEELRKKQPSALSESDLAFLKARISYLRPDEVTYFGLEEATAGSKAPTLTKAQLQEALTAKGVEFDPAATKAQLQVLLDEQPAE